MAMFVEENCVFEHEGQRFEAVGAYFLDCSDGFCRGMVYACPSKGTVTTWRGVELAKATFGPIYRDGFGARMRSVRFVLEGVTYSGRYGCDWTDAVRVRSTKKV